MFAHLLIFHWAILYLSQFCGICGKYIACYGWKWHAGILEPTYAGPLLWYCNVQIIRYFSTKHFENGQLWKSLLFAIILAAGFEVFAKVSLDQRIPNQGNNTEGEAPLSRTRGSTISNERLHFIEHEAPLYWTRGSTISNERLHYTFVASFQGQIWHERLGMKLLWFVLSNQERCRSESQVILLFWLLQALRSLFLNSN